MLHKSIFHLVFFFCTLHIERLYLSVHLWSERRSRIGNVEIAHKHLKIQITFLCVRLMQKCNMLKMKMAFELWWHFFAVQMWHLAHCAIALLPSFAIVSVHIFTESASIHCAKYRLWKASKQSIQSLIAPFFVRKTLKNCTNLYLINHKILITTFAPPFFSFFNSRHWH